MADKYFDEDENIVLRVKKRRGMWFLIGFMVPLWLLISLPFVVSCFNNVFMDRLSFRSDTEYTMSIFMLLSLIPISFIITISYIVNDLVITDKKIIIIKGITGKTLFINFKDIRAFENLSVVSRGVVFNYIKFYFKNGKKTRTGNLYVKDDSLGDLLKAIGGKVKSFIFLREDIKRLKIDPKYKCEIKIRRNIIYPLLCFGPMIIALVMFVLYNANFNTRFSSPKDIQVYASIQERELNYKRKNKTMSYQFEVQDSQNGATYYVDVNEIIYKKYNVNDRILIKAKKGSLGIVYDISINRY